MPIVKEADWQAWVDNNDDPYGKCCVDVARKCMEILDAEPGPINADKLIMRADEEIGAKRITGFMAGCVASMVSHCHSRGEEFRRAWNMETQIHDEGEKANESGGILNPACLNISSA